MFVSKLCNYTFKNDYYSFHSQRTFQQSIIICGKKRQWKGLKQIITQDITDNSSAENVINYGSIDAPPSFKPAKKYSDISGLEANYTDPHSKLHYSNIGEFKVIKKLPSDLVAGYLTLRRANVQLQ